MLGPCKSEVINTKNWPKNPAKLAKSIIFWLFFAVKQ